jgi:hypothetical protein
MQNFDMLLPIRIGRSIGRPRERAMKNHSDDLANCAHCGEPLLMVGGRISSWRVGERYACNEFCAEAVEEQAPAWTAPPIVAASLGEVPA